MGDLMSEYNFCHDIKNIYGISELNSKTLEYRLNGFIYACNMNLEEGIYTKCISSNRLPYINKKREDVKINYNINFALGHDREKGNNTIFIGKYNDLNLYFINYYNKDRNKDRVNEIPFQITLGKMYRDYTYQIDIRSVNESRIKIAVKRDKKTEMFPSVVSFTVNVNDFGKILKLVKSFVYNPELVFITYDEVVNRKELLFTVKDLNAGLVEDEKLDKPLSKTGKILKKLINND
jgi:hypothetical protein